MDPVAGSVTLDHGAIEDVLVPGRSTFPTVGPELLRHVRVGDRIAFTLTASEGAHGLLTVAAVQILRPAAPPEGLADRARAVDVSRLLLVLGLVALGGLVALTVLQYRHLARSHRTLVEFVQDDLTRTRRLQGQYEETAMRLDAILFMLGVAARGFRASLRRVTEQVDRARTLPTATSGTPQFLVIVRADDVETYAFLQKRLARSGLARVVWDRRRAERRTRQDPVLAERRQRDRRGPAEVTWTGLGYVLVDTRSRPLVVVT